MFFLYTVVEKFRIIDLVSGILVGWVRVILEYSILHCRDPPSRVDHTQSSMLALWAPQELEPVTSRTEGCAKVHSAMAID